MNGQAIQLEEIRELKKGLIKLNWEVISSNSLEKLIDLFEKLHVELDRLNEIEELQQVQVQVWNVLMTYPLRDKFIQIRCFKPPLESQEQKLVHLLWQAQLKYDAMASRFAMKDGFNLSEAIRLFVTKIEIPSSVLSLSDKQQMAQQIAFEGFALSEEMESKWLTPWKIEQQRSLEWNLHNVAIHRNHESIENSCKLLNDFNQELDRLNGFKNHTLLRQQFNQSVIPDFLKDQSLDLNAIQLPLTDQEAEFFLLLRKIRTNLAILETKIPEKDLTHQKLHQLMNAIRFPQHYLSLEERERELQLANEKGMNIPPIEIEQSLQKTKDWKPTEIQRNLVKLAQLELRSAELIDETKQLFESFHAELDRLFQLQDKNDLASQTPKILMHNFLAKKELRLFSATQIPLTENELELTSLILTAQLKLELIKQKGNKLGIETHTHFNQSIDRFNHNIQLPSRQFTSENKEQILQQLSYSGFFPSKLTIDKYIESRIQEWEIEELQKGLFELSKPTVRLPQQIDHTKQLLESFHTELNRLFMIEDKEILEEQTPKILLFDFIVKHKQLRLFSEPQTSLSANELELARFIQKAQIKLKLIRENGERLEIEQGSYFYRSIDRFNHYIQLSSRLFTTKDRELMVQQIVEDGFSLSKAINEEYIKRKIWEWEVRELEDVLLGLSKTTSPKQIDKAKSLFESFHAELDRLYSTEDKETLEKQTPRILMKNLLGKHEQIRLFSTAQTPLSGNELELACLIQSAQLKLELFKKKGKKLGIRRRSYFNLSINRFTRNIQLSGRLFSSESREQLVQQAKNDGFFPSKLDIDEHIERRIQEWEIEELEKSLFELSKPMMPSSTQMIEVRKLLEEFCAELDRLDKIKDKEILETQIPRILMPNFLGKHEQLQLFPLETSPSMDSIKMARLLQNAQSRLKSIKENGNQLGIKNKSYFYQTIDQFTNKIQLPVHILTAVDRENMKQQATNVNLSSSKRINEHMERRIQKWGIEELQKGLFELSKPTTISNQKMNEIRQHLEIYSKELDRLNTIEDRESFEKQTSRILMPDLIGNQALHLFPIAKKSLYGNSLELARFIRKTQLKLELIKEKGSQLGIETNSDFHRSMERFAQNIQLSSRLFTKADRERMVHQVVKEGYLIPEPIMDKYIQPRIQKWETEKLERGLFELSKPTIISTQKMNEIRQCLEAYSEELDRLNTIEDRESFEKQTSRILMPDLIGQKPLYLFPTAKKSLYGNSLELARLIQKTQLKLELIKEKGGQLEIETNSDFYQIVSRFSYVFQLPSQLLSPKYIRSVQQKEEILLPLFLNVLDQWNKGERDRGILKRIWSEVERPEIPMKDDLKWYRLYVQVKLSKGKLNRSSQDWNWFQGAEQFLDFRLNPLAVSLQEKENIFRILKYHGYPISTTERMDTCIIEPIAKGLRFLQGTSPPYQMDAAEMENLLVACRVFTGILDENVQKGNVKQARWMTTRLQQQLEKKSRHPIPKEHQEHAPLENKHDVYLSLLGIQARVYMLSSSTWEDRQLNQFTVQSLVSDQPLDAVKLEDWYNKLQKINKYSFGKLQEKRVPPTLKKVIRRFISSHRNRLTVPKENLSIIRSDKYRKI
ncbi:hypothetical protein [Seinonella peptonophila]|nr:hypothetical protein [Seinonella peptonophila]